MSTYDRYMCELDRRRLARKQLRVERELAFLERRGEQAQPAYQVLRAERDELSQLLRST